MHIELSQEDETTLQALVAKGQFTSVEEAVHVAVLNVAEQHAAWMAYMKRGIQEGLDDIENGRLVDGKQVMQRLRNRVRAAA